MNKRVISYAENDFEGAKILHLSESSFKGEFNFTVTDILKVTEHNVKFSNRSISQKLKAKRAFGVFDSYYSFFLVRKNQTVDEAIKEVVRALEDYFSEMSDEITNRRNALYNAWNGFKE